MSIDDFGHAKMNAVQNRRPTTRVENNPIQAVYTVFVELALFPFLDKVHCPLSGKTKDSRLFSDSRLSLSLQAETETIIYMFST